MSHDQPNRFRYAALIAAVIGALALFIGGVAFGVWFTQHFDIVPKGDMARAVEDVMKEGGTIEDVLARAGVESVDKAQLDRLLQQAGLGSLEDVNKQLQQGRTPDAALPAEASIPVETGAQPRGPFTFKFTKGEELRYRLEADVAGEGMELLGASPIKLDLDSAFKLSTWDVAPDGTGTLTMEFEHAAMSGDFMGSDFRMLEGPQGSVLQSNGQTLVDTAKGIGSDQGIPQMEFFKQPIQMEVRPDGIVTNVRGQTGLESLVQEMPLFSNLEFPEGELQQGMRWESRMKMPVPGFGAPVEARVVNTFAGYQQVGNRLCAVVQQEFRSADKANTLSMPESALGAALGFSMPQFDLGGKNLIYFDAANGQMVHGDMDLKLKLDIGKALGGSADALGEIGKGLGDLLGGVPELEGILPSNKGDKNLLDM
ncbi:MAG: hypothetical protein HYZ00_00315, partial [Candidatus Hydrogenedentes bacterium]|nr:hypothetical protein [Candidatus Hydrogenedentota bacterium]